MSKSSELWFVLNVYKDHDQLAFCAEDIGGGNPPKDQQCLSDVEWLRNSFECSGVEEALGDSLPREEGVYVIRGIMVAETIDSLDYGRDYDEYFDVSSITPIPERAP